MWGKYGRYGKDEEISVLKGKTLKAIDNFDNDELVFRTVEGEVYKMYHEGECCESVTIEDIAGDLSDIIGEPLLMAEEISEERAKLDEYDECFTWTFYKFATINGYVTIRWYGTSNGYYSESVDFVRIEDETEA